MEPSITINGVSLSEGQAMTIRVALSEFVMELRDNGLGEDMHGQVMTEAYILRANEVLRLMANVKLNGGEAVRSDAS